MNFKLPALLGDELVALRLRALYEAEGYRMYRMGSFEEYDLYMQNRPFLSDDDIITFNGADGRLMALKPDVTLSIVKNTPAGEVRRLYYAENVFRRSRQTGEYREIHQMGLEFIGGEGQNAEAEVLSLAAASLAAVGSATLDLSHMEFIEAMLAPFGTGEERAAALQALRSKSPHLMAQAAQKAGLPEETAANLTRLAGLAGPYEAVLPLAMELASSMPQTARPLQQLAGLCHSLRQSAVEVRLDFSILNDINYYNGLIFQGFVKGIPAPVLTGGRYDNLLNRFDKPQGAIGFALYLDAFGRSFATAATPTDPPDACPWLNVALPKGRMGNRVYALFAKAGFSCKGMLDESRKLVFEDAENKVRYFLVKPGDVDIYVEHGAADIGVCGKDVLLESGADVLELLDLKLGACRLAVAGKADFCENLALPLRVATKYPAIARRYYAAQSRSVEIINLHGSIELAPLLGLADVIMDIVESGSTLRENNLAVLAEVAPSSARLIANRAAWRFKGEVIQKLAKTLEALL